MIRPNATSIIENNIKYWEILQKQLYYYQQLACPDVY